MNFIVFVPAGILLSAPFANLPSSLVDHAIRTVADWTGTAPAASLL